MNYCNCVDEFHHYYTDNEIIVGDINPSNYVFYEIKPADEFENTDLKEHADPYLLKTVDDYLNKQFGDYDENSYQSDSFTSGDESKNEKTKNKAVEIKKRQNNIRDTSERSCTPHCDSRLRIRMKKNLFQQEASEKEFEKYNHQEYANRKYSRACFDESFQGSSPNFQTTHLKNNDFDSSQNKSSSATHTPIFTNQDSNPCSEYLRDY